MSKDPRKFHVPDALANVYDFANTLDLRQFTHHGVQHEQAEELASPSALADWMKARGLAERGAVQRRGSLAEGFRAGAARSAIVSNASRPRAAARRPWSMRSTRH